MSVEKLFAAVIRNDVKSVDSLLKSGVDVDAREGYAFEWTALICAVVHGHEEVAKLLIANGASVDAVSEGGNTALMFAAVNDHEGVVKLLLESNANIDLRNENGKTALDYVRGSEKKKDFVLEVMKSWICGRRKIQPGDGSLMAEYGGFIKEEVTHVASLRSQLFLHVIGDRDILKICHEGKGFFATLKRNFRALRNLDENLIIMLKGAYREALRFAKFGEMGEFLRRWAVISERENGEVIEKCANHPHSSYSGDFAESIGNLEMLRAVKRRIVRILKSDHLSVDDAIFALYFINYDYVNVVKNLESDLGEVDDFAKAFVKEMEEGDAKREWGLLGVLENTHVMRLKREYVDGVTR